MARHKGTNIEKRILDALTVGQTITPTELDAIIGGPYSSKWVSMFRLHIGHDFTCVKSGRTVTHYVYNGPIPNFQPRKPRPEPKQKTEKPSKVAKPAQAKAPAPVEEDDDTPIMDKSPSAEPASNETLQAYGGDTHSIDPDWDAYDGLNMKVLAEGANG
jgi:hypothetical protein